MISGSIVLYMILHGLHSAFYCGSNVTMGLPLITAITAMVYFIVGF
jgi:hypothetical protein